MANWCERLLLLHHTVGVMGDAELMKTWSCPQWALVQQVTVLVINIIQPLMKNNSDSLVAPPFIGIAVTCREIIACSGSQFIWERIRVSTQVVGDVQPKNQISSLVEIFLGFCKGGLRLKRRSKDAQPCVQADPLSTFWVMAFVPMKLLTGSGGYNSNACRSPVGRVKPARWGCGELESLSMGQPRGAAVAVGRWALYDCSLEGQLIKGLKNTCGPWQVCESLVCNAGHVLERRLGRIFENVGKTLRSLKEIYTDHITELRLSSVRLPEKGLGSHWWVGGSWKLQQDAPHLGFSKRHYAALRSPGH